jgi:hypothetical protein
MSDVELVIAQALLRCRRVAAGAAELMPMLGGVMPYQGADVSALPLIERTAAVAFIKRFEQLQDLIARLARASASWEGVDATSLTHRDIGDWLEKRALLDKAEEWMVAVRLRNRLAHEYPVDEGEQVRRLNECWGLMPLLHGVLSAFDAWLQQKGLASQ